MDQGDTARFEIITDRKQQAHDIMAEVMRKEDPIQKYRPATAELCMLAAHSQGARRNRI